MASHTPFLDRKIVDIPEMATIPVKTWVEGDTVSAGHQGRFREQSYALKDEDICFMPLQQRCIEQFGASRRSQSTRTPR